MVASGCAALAGAPAPAWDEMALNLAATTVQIAGGHAGTMPSISRRVLSRITEVTRWIEESPDEPHGIASLAARARLSPYHFLRTFERLTGVTPHQFVLRTRLRRAAADVVRLGDRIIDVAFRSGFSDVSNFNRAFRAEFGMSPRGYRARASGRVNVLS
jgi:AraC-like DNA-binding protein